MKAVEAIKIIREAYAHDRVESLVRGDVEDVEIALGLRTHRTHSRKRGGISHLFEEVQPEAKVGRNEPCHCGSGKKYKKCCLAKDEAVRFPVPLDLTDQQKESIIKDSQKYPVDDILINCDWKEFGLASIIVIRSMDESHYILATYLIDMNCLGVKNACSDAGVTSKMIHEMVTNYPGEMESFCHGCAQQLVSQAVEYARNLGFDPHPDFELAQYVLGEKEDCEDRDFKFGGIDGKPLFVAGPEDDQQAILDKLTARLGKDGFNYVLSEDRDLDVRG